VVSSFRSYPQKTSVQFSSPTYVSLPHIPAVLSAWSVNSCSRGKRDYFPLPVKHSKDENLALISVQKVLITLSNLHCVRPFNGSSGQQNTKVIFSGFS